ncbi:MAG: SBBP repeat-containing protein, partial [Bacteroidota bacterium]
MKKVYLSLSFCLFIFALRAQVAINENNTNPDASAMLDVSSTDKGLLVPRMTTEERDLIESPAEGLMIYNTSDSCFNYYTGVEWYKDCGRDLETDSVIYEPIIANSTGDENAQDVVFDNSGNAYITGTFMDDFHIGDTTLTSSGNRDVYLAKFDSENNLIWAFQEGGSTTESDPKIAIDSQGDLILTVRFSSTFTIDTSNLNPIGSSDIFVAKYNSDGVPQWAQQLGFSDVGIKPSVAVDASDNIYLSGYFEGSTTIASTTLSNPSAGDYASYIIKMDTNGTAQWAQQLDVVDDDLTIYDIAVHANHVYVAGAMEGTVATIGTDTYNVQGGLDGFFAQYDLDGNYVASSHLISSYYVECYTIAVDQNGNIFVGGYAFENMDFDGTTFQILGGDCLFIAKYDSNQDLEWVRYQDQNDDSEINALCIDDESNLLGIGRFEGRMDFGATTVNTASNEYEVFVLKYDNDVNFKWIEKGTSNDLSRDFG